MMDFKDDFKVFLTERRKDSISDLGEKEGIYLNFSNLLDSYLKKVSDIDSDLAEEMDTALNYMRKVEHETIYNLGFTDGISLQELAHPELNN